MGFRDYMHTTSESQGVVHRGTSLIRNRPLPGQPYSRTLGLGVLYMSGPRGARFLMSEVPVQHEGQERP